jgi:hypothetical protein
MFRHVALFRFVPDITDGQRAALHAGLAALPGRIPEIREYRYGPDAGAVEGNWDFAVIADFDDRAGFEVYAPHPAHQAFIAECMAPVLSERAALQLDLPDTGPAPATGA